MFNYKLFIDLETTSKNSVDIVDTGAGELIPASGILQIYAELYKGDTLIDVFNMSALPDQKQIKHAFNKDLISKLITTGITNTQDILERSFLSFLRKHIDPYNQYHKSAFIAYNANFDESFIREIIRRTGLQWGNFFIQKSICLYELATFALGDRCIVMKDLQMSTVAASFGIHVKPSKLHEAGYDVYLLKEIWNRLNVELNKPNNIIKC